MIKILWGRHPAYANGEWIKLAARYARARIEQKFQLIWMDVGMHPNAFKDIPNAKIWHFQNGSPIRITLKPGQTVEFYEGGRTDEGYSHEWTRYTHHGEFVANEWMDKSRDCDGPMESWGMREARIDRIGEDGTLEDVGYPEVKRTQWEHCSREQRDHLAEAAGY